MSAAGAYAPVAPAWFIPAGATVAHLIIQPEPGSWQWIYGCDREPDLLFRRALNSDPLCDACREVLAGMLRSAVAARRLVTADSGDSPAPGSTR
jgi:hypothetical protein